MVKMLGHLIIVLHMVNIYRVDWHFIENINRYS